MRAAALLLLSLAGCSSAPDEQLVALRSARSIVAEWSEVARLQNEGRASATYAAETADEARTQLASTRRAFTDPNDPAARLIDGLSGASPDAARLASAARTLGEMEQARAVR